MRVALEHPANTGILQYLRGSRGLARSSVVATVPSLSPEAVDDPYYQLGTHPDLVEWLWEGMTRKLPVPCRWVVYGTPALVHPTSGIVFGFAGGTHTYALRLPEPEREVALQRGAKRLHVYAAYPCLGLAASELNLDAIGAEWIFGAWMKEEIDWCLAAFRFAEASGISQQ